MKFPSIFFFLLIILIGEESYFLNTEDDFTVELEATTRIIIYGLMYFINKNSSLTFNNTHNDDLKVTCPYKNMEIVDILWLVYPTNIFINKTINTKKDYINEKWNFLSEKIGNPLTTLFNRSSGNILHIKNYNSDEWEEFVLICLLQNSNYITLFKNTVDLIKKYHDNKNLLEKNIQKKLRDWYISEKLDFILVISNKKNLKTLKENFNIKFLKESTKASTKMTDILTTTITIEKLMKEEKKENSLNIFDNIEIEGVVILLICISGLMSLFFFNEYQYRKNKNKIKLLKSEQEKIAKIEILSNRV